MYQRVVDSGVTHYIWRTQEDNRVRPGHAVLNMKRISLAIKHIFPVRSIIAVAGRNRIGKQKQGQLDGQLKTVFVKVRLYFDTIKSLFCYIHKSEKSDAYIEYQRVVDSGVTHYIWRTQEDNRVRPGHAVLNMKRISLAIKHIFPVRSIIAVAGRNRIGKQKQGQLDGQLKTVFVKVRLYFDTIKSLFCYIHKSEKSDAYIEAAFDMAQDLDITAENRATIKGDAEKQKKKMALIRILILTHVASGIPVNQYAPQLDGQLKTVFVKVRLYFDTIKSLFCYIHKSEKSDAYIEAAFDMAQDLDITAENRATIKGDAEKQKKKMALIRILILTHVARIGLQVYQTPHGERREFRPASARQPERKG
uniref:Capsid and scaffold protein n=1 Tax=Vibrio phage Vc1 TaxID=1480731 RepID=A0A6M5CB62_9CAUD